MRCIHAGDYTVEQSWDQITVKFYNRDYFREFVESLMTRYTALRVWNDPRRLPVGSVTSCSGLQVRLSLSRESRSLTVNDVGASSWVMGDFQTICKNISVTGSCSRHEHVSTVSRSLCIVTRQWLLNTIVY